MAMTPADARVAYDGELVDGLDRRVRGLVRSEGVVRDHDEWSLTGMVAPVIARNGSHELTNPMTSGAQVQELVKRMLKSSALEFLDHRARFPPSRAGQATRRSFQASVDPQVALARTGQEGWGTKPG